MIDLYYWPTPNGHKITLFLEESALPYRLIPVDIGRGDQFKPEFLRISPNNRMPAIVDLAPTGGGEPFAVFESGAILLYLAEKTGRFLPTGLRERSETVQWLFWQMAGLGPMAGQAHHFRQYATVELPYAIERYTREVRRLYGVLERRLAEREMINGVDYSIADMAVYPWIVPHAQQGVALEEFPRLEAWFERIQARPATARAYARAGDMPRTGKTVDEESRRYLFGQGATDETR